MYLAYKNNKSIASILVLLGAMVSSASASECSSLKFKQTEINGTDYVTRIKLNNGNLLASEVTKYDKALSMKTKRYGRIGESEKRVVKGNKVYFLEEGQHYLTIELWKKTLFKRLFTTSVYSEFSFRGRRFIPTKVSTVQLKIESDLAYELDVDIDGEVLVTSTKSLCELKQNNLLSAVSNEGSEIESIKTLPDQLEKRLRVAMNKLFASGQPFGVIGSQVSQLFGAVRDNTYKGKEGEVRLLSVLPFSLAHNIGLLSGDVIVGYGNKAYPTLSNFLDSLEYKKKIEINVLRNDTVVELKMDYKPVVIPQVVYGTNENHLQNSLILGVELDDEIQFEFNQVVLEVTNFYLENNYSGNLTLIRHDSINKLFGLIGTLNKTTHSEYSITVDEVLPYSAAHTLGLKVGDSISSVNNKKMNSRDLKHINRELRELKVGELYTVVIQRGENTITLTDNYNPSENSAFNLVIDLDAKEKYQGIVATVGSIQRKIYMHANTGKMGGSQYGNGDSGYKAGVKAVQRSDAADKRYQGSN